MNKSAERKKRGEKKTANKTGVLAEAFANTYDKIRIYARPKRDAAIAARREYEVGKILAERFSGKVTKKFKSLEQACKAHGVDSRQVRNHTGRLAVSENALRQIVKDMRTMAYHTDFKDIEEDKDKPKWAGKVSGMSKKAAREQYVMSQGDIKKAYLKEDEAGPSGNETSGEPANV